MREKKRIIDGRQKHGSAASVDAPTGMEPVTTACAPTSESNQKPPGAQEDTQPMETVWLGTLLSFECQILWFSSCLLKFFGYFLFSQTFCYFNNSWVFFTFEFVFSLTFNTL